MKKKNTPYLSTFLLIAILVFSCSPYKSSSGLIDIKSLEPAQIMDSGYLYSTYELDEEDRTELSDELSSEVINLVEKYSHESAWPEGIDDFGSREENRDRIKEYSTFLLSDFDDKYVLIAPARLNKKMSKEYKPKKDIFFIVGKEGVEVQ